jgi:glycerol-3-phosphate cytidylyltransferase
MARVITFGTYDLFHVGHLNILRRSKELGGTLIVGVSSDELNFRKKSLYPTYPLDHRVEIVRAVRYVDEVFVEHSLEEKRAYILQHRADVLVMGDDWAGKFDEFLDICRVVYLPRTEGISSTDVKSQLRDPAADPKLPTALRRASVHVA